MFCQIACPEEPMAHNHIAQAAELEARRHLNKMKVANEAGSISSAAAARMPLIRSVKRTIRRVIATEN